MVGLKEYFQKREINFESNQQMLIMIFHMAFLTGENPIWILKQQKCATYHRPGGSRVLLTNS